MKDFIQKNADDVSIVIYDSPLPPKYFRITKRFIKILFVTIPVLFTSILIGLFFWGLGTRLKYGPTPDLPELISPAERKAQELAEEIKRLEVINSELTNKLSETSSPPTQEEPFLMNIKRPYGMRVLTSEQKVTLDQFDLQQDKNKINLKFQIISSTPETKVTGHIIVFMTSEKGILTYPPSLLISAHQGIKFSMGEPFSVSRLRPTNAEFMLSNSVNNAKFVIYIFNREGDLLLVKETENFDLGSKP
jgi:hypothetical protein